MVHILNVIAGDYSIRKLFRDPALDAEIENKVRTKLDELAKETSEKYDIEVTDGIVHGKIYEEIVKTADAIDAAFIIMGTNGTEGIREKFIGSNALRVVRESHKPVITIKGKSHRKGCQTSFFL